MKTEGLKRRLKYYGLGFGLGLVLVWATLLKDRDRAAWLPEGRILEFLEEVDMEITEKAQCQINCLDLDSNFMDAAFWENAEVIYDKSAVHRKPCPEHFIQSKLPDGRTIGIYVENCETCESCEAERTAFLRGVEVGEKKCDC